MIQIVLNIYEFIILNNCDFVIVKIQILNVQGDCTILYEFYHGGETVKGRSIRGSGGVAAIVVNQPIRHQPLYKRETKEPFTRSLTPLPEAQREMGYLLHPCLLYPFANG